MSFFTKIKKRPILGSVLVVVSLLLGYLFFWPVPFSPAPDKLSGVNPAGTGVYAKNSKLAQAQMINSGAGPEGIAIDRQGRLYTGLHDGRIVRIDGDEISELANTGGRPLGLEFDKAGRLIIADAHKGLLSLAPDGTLKVLTAKYDGKPLIFVDDVAIADDGKIYFSDASAKYKMGAEIVEAFERRPSGRLFVYNPTDGSTRLLLDKLHFSNGVALGANDAFVLVNETFAYRITRLWLKGDKKGQSEVFTDNLPGFPDNITEAPDGGFWVALVSARTEQLDAMIESPFRRKIAWRVLSLTGSSPVVPHSYAIKLNAAGQPVDSLEDDSGHIFMMTSVIERAGKLYLGSLINDAIGVVSAP